ncbi:MAG: transcriptional regulator [Lysobacterales bacterium]|jgi:FeS assembly SUF system regulator|nr:MAG: transcriptional regulator [Xanthomonadales bacterium]
MLRVSRLSDYAAAVMGCLAAEPARILSAAEIAEQAHLELPTVSKLLKRLAHAGLVESFRGARGGYRLRRDPAAISLAEVVEAIDGPIAMTDCAIRARLCERERLCTVRESWQRVSRTIERALREVSVAELACARSIPVQVHA